MKLKEINQPEGIILYMRVDLVERWVRAHPISTVGCRHCFAIDNYLTTS
jgi:hypothetical protein